MGQPADNRAAPGSFTATASAPAVGFDDSTGQDRTGGLEAGIALHILNNFLAFGFALAFGDLGSTLNVSSVSWWNIVLTVTQSGVYTGLVLLVAHRMGLQTRTRPPSLEPSNGSDTTSVTA